MGHIKLKVPDAMVSRDENQVFVRWKHIGLAVEDGIIEAPRWLVPDLLAQGAVRIEGDHESINTREELEKAGGSDLSIFLNAHGVRDHRTDYKTHYLSQFHRHHAEHGCPKCGHKHEIPGTVAPLNLHEQTASTLDSFHQTVNGVGRIVVMTDDEKRTAALALFDGLKK